MVTPPKRESLVRGGAPAFRPRDARRESPHPNRISAPFKSGRDRCCTAPSGFSCPIR